MISSPSYMQSEDSLSYNERRGTRAPFFTLIEIDPRDVIDGVMLEQGYLSDDAQSSGTMREVCPHCNGVALQLILRFRHVKRAHLFCDCCTRCYDALYPDGSSALVLGAVSLV
ncbi:hypothetical protein QN372_16080 [Undibacterium sp. RTI2.1]|uniref:hypothetical protein n=1 Tax=unclassified Undibacterium TaxID=2630295 RepID=UPI002B23C1A5|nr:MULTISPECIES: hypothetical protein [unclassified Undibacterium]MEB0032277.1 hypothetical protein [Undibacterium sp. RTI2.1]MEB0118413.1 hypothetical protein [Undibacterium sp. RTI2.2]